MELKTGYKQTEVGVIPSDWEVKKVGEVFAFYSTSNYSKAEMSIEGEIGCFHYGLVHAISNTSFSLGNGVKYYIKSDKARYEQIKDGDIVMVDASEDLAGVNKSVEVFGVGNKKFIAGLHTYLMRDLNLVLADYFRGQVLNSRMIKTQMISFAVGMKVFGVSKAQLKEILIPIPTFAEQTAIATALSDTDQYITLLEKLITKKRNIKQGAMQELLKPKEGWVVNTYGEIFDFLTTATYSRADLSDTGEIGYVHYGDIHTKWSSFLDFEKYKLPTIEKNQLKNYPLLREGDIIMADASEDYSGVGESVEVKNLGENKSIAGLHTFLLRDKKGAFVNGFKGYIHKCKVVKNQIEKLASGLKVYGISKHNLKAVQIPIPPIEEQTRIASILSDMDSEIATLETKLSKAQSIKQGMMQQLLTGKIRLL